MECVREYKYYIAAKPMSCPYEGNPCSPATGNKTQTETDFTLANSSLKVQRYYSSQGVGDGFEALGPRWHHNYSQRFDGYGPETHIEFLEKSPLYDIPEAACTEGWEELKGGVYHGLLADTTPVYNGGTCDIRRNDGVVLVLPVRNTLSGQGDTETRTVNRNNGGAITFSYRAVENSTQESWQPLHPTNASLTQLSTTWSFTASDGAVETYDSEGKLLTTKDRNSQTTTFAYDEQGQLNLVTGHFGDTLTYHYDEIGHLICITTPEGDLNYGYDTDGRLNRVTYIDGSERHYHYEDSRFPYHLTGITDEKDERYASWAYDIKGRAVSSEHANGAERVTFNYNGDGTTTVTDAVGAARTYHFIVKQGAMKVIHIEGDRCTTCSNGGTKAYTYDTNGFIASRTDWNGHVTTYTRDAQGRELNRTEASGTPEARMVTTSWDTVLNKPLVITEPGRVTEYNYDENGHLLRRQQLPEGL
ncbi:MAG: hypothetical protein KZQ82_07125 [Candidatus Thiodiazotropha sp. (ex Lucinoma annulata)]|nr:hypothetical protein [Candidatus Thiodiazotropha sp. (ex Lucinoma annulata)]